MIGQRIPGALLGRGGPAPDLVVRIPDGRNISVARHGDPAGWPVFLLHGVPSSRLGFEFTDVPARQRGIRVLCPDRPGIGRSDAKPGRTLVDYADDLLALADALGISTFSVLGYSCGGPYAIAVAARASKRVVTTGVMAGSAPLDWPGTRESLARTDRQLLHLASRYPRVAAQVLRGMGLQTRLQPGLALKVFMKDLSEVDRRALADTGLSLMASCAEAVARGPAGAVEEYGIWSKPWGFRLEDVVGRIQLWHGDADRLIPWSHAELLAAKLPNAVLTRLAGEGHFSLQHHIGAIFDALLPPVSARWTAAMSMRLSRE